MSRSLSKSLNIFSCSIQNKSHQTLIISLSVGPALKLVCTKNVIRNLPYNFNLEILAILLSKISLSGHTQNPKPTTSMPLSELPKKTQRALRWSELSAKGRDIFSWFVKNSSVMWYAASVWDFPYTLMIRTSDISWAFLSCRKKWYENRDVSQFMCRNEVQG